ncbi:hypothetical protein SAY87_010506 [Trapa incisa]|uniref:S-adenosyl-L-methionine-dependent methyltransferase n=1 Tax=Trapa incisa TaxID=236973 RepID=A0AAN7GU97_9MYRT|nr:hypothetical protein SAY87_010506 [Trapa incisa]
MKSCLLPKCRLTRLLAWLQIVLGGLVVVVSLSTLFTFYRAGFPIHHEDICRHVYGVKETAAATALNDQPRFDVLSLSNRIGEVLNKLDRLQQKLEFKVKQMEKNDKNSSISTLEYKKYLEDEIVRPLYAAHIDLRQIRLPKLDGDGPNATLNEDPLINTFIVEEIRKYITPKESRVGKVNIYGTDRVYNAIGHGCVRYKKELEEYMDYDIGSYCKDDWDLAQRLMINGCDPVPRRRCLARASKTYQRPLPINESLWKVPEDRNVRWSRYACRNFKCLNATNAKRGYSKCSGCFDMEKERLKWVAAAPNGSLAVDFSIDDVIAIKPGEIRIGLDFGIGTGTFAARMREHNVTVISTALNLGAPFSEVIALRGLVPLYVTLNQRLPFFDNTMDMIHTAGFLDGWIDLLLMDFILFDWDRVLRPGGLLWVDRFFCKRKDLDDYMYMFLQFRYKKRKWSVYPKSKDEVYLSAVLEKPPRAI